MSKAFGVCGCLTGGLGILSQALESLGRRNLKHLGFPLAAVVKWWSGSDGALGTAAAPRSTARGSRLEPGSTCVAGCRCCDVPSNSGSGTRDVRGLADAQGAY